VSHHPKDGNKFGRDVSRFAEEHEIPMLHLEKPDRTGWDDRKLDHVQPYLEAGFLLLAIRSDLRGSGRCRNPDLDLTPRQGCLQSED
jgi:hypothetical protein